MRKILFFAMCVAGLAAASCQNEKLETVGNEAQVTLALDVEKAMVTRSATENGADQLAYAVYNEDNQHYEINIK